MRARWQTCLSMQWCVRAGAGSGPNLLVPRRCAFAGAQSGPNSNSLLSIALAFFLKLLFLGTLPLFSSDSVSESLLVK